MKEIDKLAGKGSFKNKHIWIPVGFFSFFIIAEGRKNTGTFAADTYIK